MKTLFSALGAKMVIASVLVISFGYQVTAAEAPLKPVKIDKVREMVLAASTNLNGTLHSRSHIAITAGVSGRLEWLAEPGDYVKRGDVLVKMDLLPLRLRESEQKAQMKRAKINVAYLKNELSRLQKLSKTNATSQYQLDQTRSQYELAQTDIEIADLKLKQVEDELNRAVVEAPFDGVITERIVRAGTDINRSDELLKLLDTEHLEVRLYIPIKYLAYVKKGQSLAVFTKDYQIEAPITAKIPSADARSQTFEVRITIPEHLNTVWAAGQLVRITVPIQHASESLTVHRDALILRKEGTYVVKVNNDNTVKRLRVTVGTGNLQRVSIIGDLKQGDSVAIRGAERLIDGDIVVLQ